MSDKGKLNAILILQLATFAGLAFAYFKVVPLMEKADAALNGANTLESKLNRLF